MTDSIALAPRMRLVWGVRAVFAGLWPMGMALLAAAALGGGVVVAAVGLVGSVVVVVGGLLFASAAFRAWSVRLGDGAVEVTKGVVVHRRTVVPYERVQHVDLRRGPIERALGLVEVHVSTAAQGSATSIPGLSESDAEGLRDTLLDRAGLRHGV